jgi:predicted ATPase
VQTNVARLRRLLPPAVTIATTPTGYRLLADRAEVDLTAFADHLAAAAATTDPGRRQARLAAALELWRGRPFAELDHPSLDPEVARLGELRAGAAEQHAATLLDVGRPGEAAAALEALVVAEPLRESAVALLVRALVAAGRPSDALAACARLRRKLAQDLGLDPSPELRELEQQVLRQQVPGPPAAPAAPRPRVPAVPVSSFVGREADLARAADLLDRCRIVTLCGPGGVGKTRLATHVAAAVAERFDDGVLVVGFGDGGPDDVVPLLAAALQLADDGRSVAESFVERIVGVLAVRRQLLVLDNCEHVADEVAALAEAVTAGTPGIRLLLTSREPLRVDGEHVLPVPPLAPDAAAELLLDRVRAAGVATPPDPGPAAELCRRLDGLPLALELAAARAQSLGMTALLAAIEQPLDALRGGRRTAAPRHRSLRDVVEWSVGLLDPSQRALFESLAVFAGPVEQAAVEAVCGDAAALPDLVERSLVVRDPGEPARFGMLETLRAFGRARLAVDAAGPGLRARHAAWAVRTADEIGAARRGPGEPAAVRRFDDHLPDLRRAHAWLCANGPIDDLLRLGVQFAELGYLRGRIDLVQLAERTLAAVRGPAGTGPSAHPLAAELIGLVATTCWQRGDLDAAEALGLRALAVAEASGDPAAGRVGAEALANVYAFRGDLAGSTRWAGTALELATAAGDQAGCLLAHLDLLLAAAYAGDDAGQASTRRRCSGWCPSSARRPRAASSPTASASGAPSAETGRGGAPDRVDPVGRAGDSRFVAGIAGTPCSPPRPAATVTRPRCWPGCAR